jgi:hypothetical protein
MSGNMGEALGLLGLGVLLGGWAALRIRSGKSYVLNPPTRVSRKDDPFSFWLSVMPMLVVAATLVLGALSCFYQE